MCWSTLEVGAYGAVTSKPWLSQKSVFLAWGCCVVVVGLTFETAKYWQHLPRCTRGSFTDSTRLGIGHIVTNDSKVFSSTNENDGIPLSPSRPGTTVLAAPSLLKFSQDRLGPVDHPGFKAGQDPSTLLSPIPDSAGIALHSRTRQNDNAGLPLRCQRSGICLLRCSSGSFTTLANMTTAQAVLPPLATSIISTRNVLALVGIWLAYHILKALYNISPLHPLSRIPGPKLAAATYLPEFYYDVVKYGCYTKEIAKMHEKYGEPHQVTFRILISDHLNQAPLSASALMRRTATTFPSRTRSTLSADVSVISPYIRSMAQRKPSFERMIFVLNIAD